MKKYAAQIVFLQSRKRENVWNGRLLNQNAIDVHYGVPSSMLCRIEELASGECYLMTQGSQVGSRRYSTHGSLTAAQEAAIRWAGRRFKVVVEANP